MRAYWTQEQTEDLKHMMSRGLTAGEIAEQLAVSKNAVVGKMHRLRIKNGHAPQTRKNNITRTYKGPIIGTRPCNLCSKKFNMHGRFDRFCDPCKRGGLYG